MLTIAAVRQLPILLGLKQDLGRLSQVTDIGPETRPDDSSSLH